MRKARSIFVCVPVSPAFQLVFLGLASLGLFLAGCASDGHNHASHHSFNPVKRADAAQQYYDLDLPPLDAKSPTQREPFIWPIQHPEMYISSGYGMRGSSGGRGRLHKGVDMVCPEGTPIRAAAAGTVSYSGTMSGYGQVIMIDHPGDMSTAYAHMTERFVEDGTQVLQGDIIGTVGRTGRASTEHLHYEVRQDGRALDPDPFLRGCEKFYR